MEVLKRATTPEGIAIQIENWKETYKGIFTTISIGAYPIAKNSGFCIRRDNPFRVDICRGFKSDDEVEKVFSQLQTGEVTIESLSKQFWDPRSAYYLGIESQTVERSAFA